ncbi:5-oxoprolinase subunit PxpB [Shewanella sp. GXUN23E]|uniref:5-oxoprolinase subunit PxpB n=1 Tax=Shewanella sp. GXUN23E TaxID=3422498 RepID=UPI003D7C7DB3
MTSKPLTPSASPQLVRVGENQLLLRFADAIDPTLASRIATFSHTLQGCYGSALLELIPSYTTLLLEYHPLRLSFETLASALPGLWQSSQADIPQPRLHRLPVFYGGEYGPDLPGLARHAGLTEAGVIARHADRRYTVCAIGFAPGFAFLARVDDAICHPRHPHPRVLIPKGSVGIAESQTAVYPDASPGGWQIIGNCPLTLFDPTHDPMSPFSTGDQVEFYGIDREAFLALGGEPCPRWK